LLTKNEKFQKVQFKLLHDLRDLKVVRAFACEAWKTGFDSQLGHTKDLKMVTLAAASLALTLRI